MDDNSQSLRAEANALAADERDRAEVAVIAEWMEELRAPLRSGRGS